MKTNRIYHGDFLELLSKLPDESVDLIFTDIPYNVSRDNNFKTMKDRTGRNGIDFGEWDKGFDERQLKELERVIKKGGSLFLFHAFEQYETIRDVLDGLIVKDKIIWQKTNPMPRNRDRRWISDVEIASWFVKKGDKWTFNRQDEKYERSVLQYPAESGGGYKRYHPTQKNMKLVEYLIKIHSNPHDVILDPFLGGGTTAVACINTGRQFIGFEIDEKYVEVSNKRVRDTVSDLNFPEWFAEKIELHENSENYECGCEKETMTLCLAGEFLQGCSDEVDFIIEHGLASEE